MHLSRLAWLGFLLLAACSRHEPSTSAPPLPLRICTGTTYSVLLAIANQKGLFAQQGLKVELVPHAIGRDALEAMLADKCEVATSADTPVADYGRKRDDLRIIAGISSSDRLCYLIARTEAGIRQASDLKGQPVGVSKGTAPHFFLDLFLNKHRMTERDVRLQFLNGEELNNALRRGTLSAIVTTDLNALRLQEELGPTKVTLINDPGISLNHGYLTLKEQTLVTQREALRRMMHAVRVAEQLATANPEEAKGLFAAYLQTSPAITDQLWESIVPRLSLEPAMILTLEDHARWLMEREGKTTVQKSFKDIMRPDLLREVAPNAVTLN